jgi:hypothetical protein
MKTYNIKKVGTDLLERVTTAIRPTKVLTMIDANARIHDLEQQLGTKPTATHNEPKRFTSSIPTPQISTDNKVQAILDSAEKDILSREQAVTEYAELTKSAKNMIRDRKITLEQVRYAKHFDEVHTRAEKYGNDIKLADWNKGLGAVTIKMDQLDTLFAESRAKNEQARKEIQSQYTFEPGVSTVAPIYIVDQSYYLLWDNNRVFCQPDDGEKYPFMLAKLNGGSRGSPTVMVSGGNYDYIGFDDYKALLESRPSYKSIRKAYLAIRNDRLLMDYSKATKLFE